MTAKIFSDYDIISDLAANRPATPTVAAGKLCVFQATDTGDVSIWDGTAWRLITSLNAYQEGTWTPVDGSGQGVTMGTIYATYTLIGRIVMLNFRYAPSGGTTAQAAVAGLPFNGAAGRSQTGIVTTSAGTPVNCGVNGTVCGMANASTGAIITNSTLAGQAVIPACAYSTT